MAQLVFRFPTRDRQDGAASARGAATLSYVLSEDGQTPTRHGAAPAALLPAAATVIGVLPAQALSWHQIILPKAPAQRLRAALAGVLEDALLEEPERVHLAVESQARAGAQAWVCAVDRAWLKAQIDAVEQHGIRIHRIVPEAEPTLAPTGTVIGPDDVDIDEPPPARSGAPTHQVLWADARGVLALPLRSALARELARGEATWSAEPAATVFAEEWLGRPMAVVDRATRLLETAHSAWNIRQFEFSPRSRGTRALRDLGRNLSASAWRPARWGLAALVAAQLIGLNAWAWQQEAKVRARQAEVSSLVRSTFPHVQVVLDAPVQMSRELDDLRARAGQPGAGDIEALLRALAADWPADLPIGALEYVPGQLTVVADGLDEERIVPVRESLEAGGHQATLQGNRLTVSAGLAR